MAAIGMFGRWLILAVTLVFGAAAAHGEDVVVAVPTVTIYPGDVIGDEQIIERAFAPGTLGKFAIAQDRTMLVGKVARRTLLPGKPIPLNGVKDPDVVSRGGSVLAIYKSGGLTISSVVQPLRAGGVGDIIEARNMDSGKIIRGAIQADGTLRVGAIQ
jgi:flagella basal body P-ring formation protein FlgA